MLLTGDDLGRGVSIASADLGEDRIVPALDAPVPRWFAGADIRLHSGAIADRIELDDPDLNDDMSAWYRLAYVDGGTRLRVFEHYAATTRGLQSDIMQSELAAWQLANRVRGAAEVVEELDDLPPWGRIRTGTDYGGSAGLMFTLAFLDLLTSGRLVGALRCRHRRHRCRRSRVSSLQVELKVAAAELARPDVIFTPRPSELTADTTIVESEHTRNPAAGYTIGEWLNVVGYDEAGREQRRIQERLRTLSCMTSVRHWPFSAVAPQA